MFDFDASKLLIVGVVALIFIPPKDLPRVLRQVGQFVGKMRRMASDFQGQFMDAMREADLADLREEARKLTDAVKVDAGLGSVADLGNHLTGAIEGRPVMMETTPSPVEPEQPRQSMASVAADDGAVPSAAPVPVDAPGIVHDGAQAHGGAIRADGDDHRAHSAAEMTAIEVPAADAPVMSPSA